MPKAETLAELATNGRTPQWMKFASAFVERVGVPFVFAAAMFYLVENGIAKLTDAIHESNSVTTAFQAGVVKDHASMLEILKKRNP